MINFLLIIFIISVTDAFVVPGVAPEDYVQSQPVEIKAVKLTSDKTQLPYDYYSVPFCRPSGELIYKSENLGEILRGDRIVNTPFKLLVLEQRSCTLVCPKKTLSPASVSALIARIKEEYSVHLLADGLPVATPFKNVQTNFVEYETGYRLGIHDSGKFALNNYLQFVLKYHHMEESNTFRIVGFEVYPRSVSPEEIQVSESGRCNVINQTPAPLILNQGQANDVVFAYEVQWTLSPVRWASRWDVYLAQRDGQIHWFNIINALIIVLLMTGIVTLIIIRTLRRDIAFYNHEDDFEGQLEESGWKMIHGDVFRPPMYPKFLSCLVGSGMQIACMFAVIIVLAMLGMISPASRGSIMTAGIFFYCVMGLVGGYQAGRLYKTLKGTRWKSGAFLTAIFFPGILISVTFILNFFIWGKKSSGAVPFTTMVAILTIWFGVALPLVMLGYYFGFRNSPYEHPLKVRLIARVVPVQSWHYELLPMMLMGGLLPFGAVFLELSFIFTAIWKHQFYFLFGFLFAVFVILIVTTAQVSVIVTYFQLCSENYHWWWRSFLISAGPAVYLMFYSVTYFYMRLDITSLIPMLLYFGYSFLMVVTFGLLTGSIGFYAAYFFIKKIYKELHID